jgi:hypothetical protein
MKIFKRLFDFYINTSIHVAIAVFSLFQITKITLNISSDFFVDFFVFFGTILGYNFLKYIAVFKNKVFNFKNNSSIVLISLMAVCGAMYCFFRLDPNTQWAFIKIGIIVVLYPFLRKYSFFKMLVVAICIAYITAYIPVLNRKCILFVEDILIIQRFLIAIALLIPLEIVTIENDAKTIVTLPQKIGIKHTKVLGYLILVVFCALDFEFSNLIMAIVIAAAIYFAHEKRAKYYTSFWVESIPILWWGLLLGFGYNSHLFRF